MAKKPKKPLVPSPTSPVTPSSTSNPTLPPELAKPGVGLHRIPLVMEIVQSQLGVGLLTADPVVKAMTDDEKDAIKTQDPAKVREAFAAARGRVRLEKQRAEAKAKREAK